MSRPIRCDPFPMEYGRDYTDYFSVHRSQKGQRKGITKASHKGQSDVYPLLLIDVKGMMVRKCWPVSGYSPVVCPETEGNLLIKAIAGAATLKFLQWMPLLTKYS